MKTIVLKTEREVEMVQRALSHFHESICRLPPLLRWCDCAEVAELFNRELAMQEQPGPDHKPN